MTFDEAVSFLREVERLEGSETGEYWGGLLHLASVIHYGPEDFADRVREQVISEATDAKQSVRIIEEEVTVTKTVKSLEWVG